MAKSTKKSSTKKGSATKKGGGSKKSAPTMPPKGMKGGMKGGGC